MNCKKKCFFKHGKSEETPNKPRGSKSAKAKQPTTVPKKSLNTEKEAIDVCRLRLNENKLYYWSGILGNCSQMRVRSGKTVLGVLNSST